MTYLRCFLPAFFLSLLIVVTAGCNKKNDASTVKSQPAREPASLLGDTYSMTTGHSLEVYKSPTCGCCTGWVDHMNESGFKLNAHDMDNLEPVKQAQGISREMRSCHTAVSKEGFVFEGHVPAKFIKRFLAEKPAGARGLAVPAMPVGTPGMEMGNKFMPYQIRLLKTDGSSEVYAKVSSFEQQY